MLKKTLIIASLFFGFIYYFYYHELTVVLKDRNNVERTFKYPKRYHNRVSQEYAFVSLLWGPNALRNHGLFKKFRECSEQYTEKENYLSLFLAFESRGRGLAGAKRLLSTGEKYKEDEVFNYVNNFHLSHLDYGLIPRKKHMKETYLLCTNRGNCRLVMAIDDTLTASVSFPQESKFCYSALLNEVPLFIENIETTRKFMSGF